MTTDYTPPVKQSSSFICKVFGHKYRVTKTYASKQREFECPHCKSQFTHDDYGRYIPLTSKWKKINEMLEKLYMHRSKRQEIKLQAA